MNRSKVGLNPFLRAAQRWLATHQRNPWLVDLGTGCKSALISVYELSSITAYREELPSWKCFLWQSVLKNQFEGILGTKRLEKKITWNLISCFLQSLSKAAKNHLGKWIFSQIFLNEINFLKCAVYFVIRFEEVACFEDATVTAW